MPKLHCANLRNPSTPAKTSEKLLRLHKKQKAATLLQPFSKVAGARLELATS
jgi:hypothetical protein